MPVTEHLRLFDTLNNILSAFTLEQPVNLAFQTTTQKLCSVLAKGHATITLLDERSRFFRIEAEYPGSKPSLIGERIMIENRRDQIALLNGQPIVVASLADRPDLLDVLGFRKVVERLDIRSLLIMPIVLNNRTIGTLGLDSIGQERQFGKQIIELCRAVASQAALAVENARLMEVETNYKRRFDLLFKESSVKPALIHTERSAQSLLSQLQGIVEFKKASVQFIEGGKRIMIGASGFKEGYTDPWLLRPVDADPLIREIVLSQRIVVIANTNSDERWGKQGSTFDVNSWIGIPLIYQKEVIGLVTLDHHESGYYDSLPDEIRNRLEDICIKATLEIYYAYELDAAQRQVRGLEVIGDVADQVAAKVYKGSLLPAIASAVSQGTGCTRCAIFFLDRDGDRLRWVCQAALPEASEAVSHFDYDECPHLKTSKPNTIQDLRADGMELPDHELFRNARSMLVVPLKIAEQIIGVVATFDEKPGSFTRADQLLLEGLTRYASIAIERDIGIELVHSINADILRAQEMADVLRNIVSGAMKLTHTDSGVIYLLNESQTEVVDQFSAEGSNHPKPRLDNQNGVTWTVIRDKKILQIQDITNDSRVNPELIRLYRSLVAVPLTLDENVIGVLYLNGVNSREFTGTEISLLSTLADQAALVIRIKNSEAMYHSLVDNIPQCVFRKDLRSRFVSANTSFCKSLEKRLDEIRGKDDFAFYPADKAKQYRADDQRVIRSRELLDQTERHQILGSNKVSWVRVVKTPVLDANREVVGVQAIFWDITLDMEVQARYQSLVDQSPDGIVLHQDGKISLTNPAATRLFGIPSDELRDRSILEFVDPSSRAAAADRLERLGRREHVPRGSLKILRRSENRTEVVDVEVHSRFGLESNEAQFVFHDLTVLREMHHRVRRGFSEIFGLLSIQEEKSKDARVRKIFKSIRGRIQAMAQVHRNLYENLRESEVEMQSYLTDLMDSVFEAYDPNGNIARKIEVESILLDERRATACGLVANELITNSLLHAFPGGRKGRVTLVLRNTNQECVFSVSDDGTGMRGAPEWSSDSMGMSLVHSFVRNELNGRFQDPKVTSGTVIEIRFPICRPVEGQ